LSLNLGEKVSKDNTIWVAVTSNRYVSMNAGGTY
jgi:hypothetical protein